MLSVSKWFKEAMQEPTKEMSTYVEVIGQSNILPDGDLVTVKIEASGDLCKTVMRKVELKYLGERNILGERVVVHSGVRLPDRHEVDNPGQFEYAPYGEYLITEITTIKDTEMTTVVGYDNMISFYHEYEPIFNYPMTALQFIKAICNACNVQFGNVSFLNDDLIIDIDYYENIAGVTYRDILQELAEISISIAMIGEDDRLYLRSVTDTGETLTYANFIKLKQEPLYGEINSLVLSRQPQDDNIELHDSISIDQFGLTEFRIVNNQLIDKRRESVLQSLFNAVKGIKYYPFDTDTEGLGWYEIGDKIKIQNNIGQTYDTIVFNYVYNFTGSFKERLYTTAKTKEQINYSRAGGLIKRIKNTEIIVDKQQNYISILNEDMYDQDGLVNKEFTEIRTDLEDIRLGVQRSGGGNLLRNSVMFATDQDGLPLEWEVLGAGTLNIQSSTESLNAGAKSGNIFTLNNKTVRQRVTVRVDSDDIPEESKLYYSFNCKVKKNIVGSGYIKIYNSIEMYQIDFNTGEDPFYSDYEIKALLPKQNYYDIELYGSSGSDMTFTDCMFHVGNFKTLWQQANGEIMNTQVNVNVDGVLVRSSVYVGDYTVMSPLEFAGYSMVNGTLTKVFTLNKDTTEMQKVEVKDGITMKPLKIVPVLSGVMQGWAIVRDE